MDDLLLAGAQMRTMLGVAIVDDQLRRCLE